MGQGHRSGRFLRLWTNSDRQFSDSLAADEWSILLNNVLEMAFCRAFQSLPSRLLNIYFEPPTSGPGFSEIGLNIISPLMQGIKFFETTRDFYVLDLSDSPDAEIAGWVSFRQSFKARQTNTLTLASQPRIVPLQCQLALENIFDDAQWPISSFSSSTANPDDTKWSEWQECVSRFRLGEPLLPFGTRHASIGFVLDHVQHLNTVSSDQSSELLAASQTLTPPWGFKEYGFYERNVLLWSYDFAQTLSVQCTDASRLQEETDQAELVKVNCDLIALSALRVVVLCGPTARNIILGSRQNLHKTAVKLGLYLYDAWLEKGSSSRLYIYCDQIPLRVGERQIRAA